ncbi:Bug family tripartite tricarboxylate transporter substrate binding protein [Parvibium lacunae]|uniref:Tripartite tricarboxylate transporter substrate binding protein n=1 Tax=Parvibium lacunae TaxID=1888893 RepID=A0A368L141_9BURK|nr:tripartite tricarboxylate transporter substrate binding protein [Parvibium lacunae]RCS57155.1 tripartite tricarboxylate transporter substrate binding protein [Parvibium lacunae]
MQYSFICRSLATLWCLFVASASFAQSFDRPFTMVVPAPPGGTADLTARALAEPLSKAIGQPVIVENKGGANGIIGGNAVARAKADGYTLLMEFSGFHTMSPHLVKFPYDPLKDLQAVANVVIAPQVMVVRGDSPFKTAADLIAYAKSNPGKLNYASSGNGSVQHITTELFEIETRSAMVHIPYRGTGPQLLGLLGGDVDLTMTTAPPLMPHIQSGKMRALMVTSRQRLIALPDVPTAAEVGMRNFEVASWFGVFTTTGTPMPFVEKLSDEIRKIVTSAEFQKKMEAQGAITRYMNPETFAAFAKAESNRWAEVIKRANIKPD